MNMMGKKGQLLPTLFLCLEISRTIFRFSKKYKICCLTPIMTKKTSENYFHECEKVASC